jgi:lysozyme family protein
MSYISYEKYGPEYKRLWDTMKIIRDASELERVSNKIKLNKAVYEKVQKATGVPWQMVAVIHLREAGERDIGRWQCVLHNGEPIVGTDKKTRLVPAGRGPFATWHEAAVHALTEKGFDKIKEWPVERMLWAMEPYNGYGYRNRGLRSPYIWASTNHQQQGKYIRDGVFDPEVMDTQVGAAAQLKFLGVGADKAHGAGTAGAVITAGAAAAATWPEYIVPILVGASLVALISFLVVRWYKTRIQSKVDNNV